MDNETKEISIQDLLSHSFDQKPIEFGDAFNTLMGDRVAAAIADRKIEVAQSMYNPPVEVDSEVEDDDDFDFEDDDVEDIDQEEQETEEAQDGESA